MNIPSKNARRRVTKRFIIKIKAINSDLHCVYCEKKVIKLRAHQHRKNGMTADHFVPVAKGGTNSFENLFVCCWQCNMQKANLNPLTDKEFWLEFLPKRLNIELA